MDSPKDPESRDWHKQKIMMSVRHDEELEDFRIQQDKEREAARKKFRERLESFGSLVSGDNYSDIVEMIQVNYERDLQRIEEGYQERTREIRKRHRAEETRHRHARLGDRLPVVASPSSPASLPSFPLTQVCYGEPQSKAASPNPWTKFPADPSPVHNQSVQSWRPYSCTVTSETANGHQRLIMRVQSRKRKSLENDYVHVNTKRLRIDTSMNSLKTPVATPPLEPGQAAPERTITFGEVYQDGQAEHKDTIVTWPVGSENFYILKCEEHKVHFKQSPIKGAAKHLNGKFHGIPHRDWNTAIKLLGYRVLDCNEALAARNNRSVDLAFENGYKPQNWMITKRGKARLGSIYRATGTPSSAQVVEQLITPVTASKARHENGVENTPEVGLGIIHSEQTPKRERPPSTVRSTSQRSTNASFRDVTHPKAFHLYYGHWVDRSKNKEEIYPVLVLGWDDLTPGGLPGKNLASTGLLESPPRCYVYNSNGIARWAEGYEDAGPKVNLRKFPVMFFDLGRTVSWLAARDMSKFPLYKAAPKDVNHPFNVARDYIATMEGFDDWNQREEARAASNLSDKHFREAHVKGKLDDIWTKEKATSITDHFDSASHDNTDTGSDSGGSNVTAKELEEVSKKLGAGDDDYEGSGADTDADDRSDVDSNLSAEMEDWDKPGTSSRPWTFYHLRGDKDPTDASTSAISRQAMTVAEMSASMEEATDAGNAGTITAKTGTQFSANPDESAGKEGSDTSVVSTQTIDKCLPGFSGPVTTTALQQHREGDSITVQQKENRVRLGQLTLDRLNENHRAQSVVSLPANNSVTTPLVMDRAASVPTTFVATNLTATLNPSAKIERLEKINQADDSATISREGTPKAGMSQTPEQNLPPLQDKTAAESVVAEGVKPISDILSGGARPPGRTPTPDRMTITSTAPPFTDELAFKIMEYTRGPESWIKGSEGAYMELFYTSDKRAVGTAKGAVLVEIDALKIAGYLRVTIPNTAGNSEISLEFEEGCGPTMKLIFDRAITARAFIRWFDRVNPDIKNLLYQVL